ncbi:hypothetical protein [Corynebacterium sp. NML130628]|uniref:hypothetical protein n=1 Tax=Corynebacterium sp. NML130628 TaxID=1906333 RepID=UPI0008FB1B65|nr:hypothetical protein [Corynebacterium sp. NML130628]OIR45496.1 hypothetical protein BJP07_03805 [Corynebacterium sp. NML130628]
MLYPLIVGTADPSHPAVSAYAFSVTLAIQDITGEANSGVSAAHIAKRLEDSEESSALLFALCRKTAPRSLGAFGYPILTEDDLYDVEGWVLVSLPLLEDVDVLEANVTVDASIAPLPGEAQPAHVWQSALELIDALSAELFRPIQHIWVTEPAGASEHPFLRDADYAPAHCEVQATIDAKSILTPGPETACDVVRDMSFNQSDLPHFLATLQESGAKYPRGSLILEPVQWSPSRLRDAAARLKDRGGSQVTAIARDASGTPVGLAEVAKFDNDADSVAEIGLIYVREDNRGIRLGERALVSALSAACSAWPEIQQFYVSYPVPEPGNKHHLLARYSPTVISRATAWQKCTPHHYR